MPCSKDKSFITQPVKPLELHSFSLGYFSIAFGQDISSCFLPLYNIPLVIAILFWFSKYLIHCRLVQIKRSSRSELRLHLVFTYYVFLFVFQGNAALLLANLEKEKELLRIFLRVSQMENAVLRRMNLNSFLMVSSPRQVLLWRRGNIVSKKIHT